VKKNEMKNEERRMKKKYEEKRMKNEENE